MRLLTIDAEEKASRRAAAQKQSEKTDPERKKYLSQHTEQRQRDKQTRLNILRDIENDKIERKEKAERARQQPSTTTTPTTMAAGVSTVVRSHEGMTKLSIRQPNSTVLKTEFESRAMLADVRVWIDGNRSDGSTSPYVLQTTFPTRTFEAAEEAQETLGSIYGKGGGLIMKVRTPAPTP
jgi:UBX domain-containing protein 1/4